MPITKWFAFIAIAGSPAVRFFDSEGFTKRRRLVSIVAEENEAFFIGALVEGVGTISPTVCTAANSQKLAFGPTHPFESYHTSGLARESVVSSNPMATDPTPSLASQLPQ
jgi:hypothetical protein